MRDYDEMKLKDMNGMQQSLTQWGNGSFFSYQYTYHSVQNSFYTMLLGISRAGGNDR